VPIGVGATRDFVREVADSPASTPSRSPPRALATAVVLARNHTTAVFIFGDATHGGCASREELAFDVVGIGTHSREFARGGGGAGRA
jgi:light-independent protochlorophyllide reductase subunit B